MQEMLVMLAKMMPEEEIVSQIEETLNNYKKDSSKDNKNKLLFSCTLFVTKEAFANKDMLESLKQLDEIEKMQKLTNFPIN